nr:putative ribonuclease H-like domain-containing protein [Tanacetum cinerariifolium]
MVLFTNTECLAMSSDFKLPDKNQLLLKIPRQHNMYSFTLKNIDPSGDLACLIAKAIIDESNKWHRRLGHVNFKNLNKLVKRNLVRGLPSKIFENDHTCVACQKGKQHKASYKGKLVSSVNQPLQILHMDLFGPTSIRRIDHKTYCLVITDDFSRFSWVHFLRSKDETTPILKDFIRQVENQFNHKVKTIRSDNGTEFKNKDLIEFYGLKGIKREYSNARTPQQNEVVKRKSMTLIEADRTMLVDSFLPTTVYNLETKRVEENLHVNFLENKPNVAGKGHAWMFDLNYLTNFMNYKHVTTENQANKSVGPKEANNSACTQANDDIGGNEEDIEPVEEHFVLPIWSAYSTSVKSSDDKILTKSGLKTCQKPVRAAKASSTNNLNTASTPVNTAGPLDIYEVPSDGIFSSASYDHEVGVAELYKFGIYREFKQKEDGIFISQDKYVAEILKKFDFISVKTASTPTETKKPLVKDEEAADVDVHLYRSMIGSFKCWLITTPQMVINSPCLTDKKELAISGKTATGKELSNLLMAGSLPKTTLPTQLLKVNAARPKLTTARVYAVEEVGVPFFMFPRFVQLIINHQLGDMSHHKEIFDTPSLTKKVFANIKRVFSKLMHHHYPFPLKHQLLNPKRSTSQRGSTHKVPPTEFLAKQNLPSPSNDPLPNGEDSLKLKALIDLCTNLSNKVLKLESEVIYIKSTYQERIKKLESRVERSLKKVLSMLDVNNVPANVEEVLEVVKATKLITAVVTTVEATKVSAPRKRRGVFIQDPEETTTTATVQPKVQAKDKGKAILVEEPKSLKRQAQVELDKEVAIRNMIVYLKNMFGFKMDYFKGMAYNKIKPLFEKHYNYNQAFLDEVNKEVKFLEKEVSQEKEAESSKREGESLEQEIAKKQKMEQETEQLKRHLQIVPDDDDDVYIDATPLASKILIIDYKIHTERNRPYFKIIRADGNHMFMSFNAMLKNFNREDLESLWKIIREKFEKTKPKNYSDDYLLNILKIMFEKLNVEANVWKYQKGRYGLAKVKSWKLIKSCRVHCITFLTTQIFLLIERMYPLTHFTLEQMINNIRLKVKDESEMSLELLRLVRRQLNEGLLLLFNLVLLLEVIAGEEERRRQY